MTRAFVIISVVVAAPCAFAQNEPPPTAAQTPSPDRTATTPGAYPLPFVDRPQILPTMMMQPTAMFGVTNNGALMTDATSTNVDVGFDMGVMNKLQAGVLVGLNTSGADGTTGLGQFYASAQYGVLDFLNARLDLGAEKTTVGGMGGGSTGFSFGVGAPIKYKLTPMISLVSGRPYAYGVGDDIIRVSMGDGYKVIYFNIPVGVQVQINPMLQASLRTGYGLMSISPDVGNSVTPKFVPLGVDVWANLMPALDVGLLFNLAGTVDSGVSGGSLGYADIRVIQAAAQYRWPQ